MPWTTTTNSNQTLLFVYTDQLLCHCVSTCSNVR